MSGHTGGNKVVEIQDEEHQHNLHAKRTIILDGSGNQITSFGGSGGGDATAANQVTGNASLDSIDTKLTDNATETTLATRLSESDFDTKVGSLTETAPATDTASSGLNGRLQRLAQRLTTLISLLPTSLGQKTKANSLAVTLASDQDALPVTDNGGSITVDGTFWQATQPVSLASVPSHAVTNAGTFAVQDSQKITDNAAFTDGTTKVQPVGFIYDEVAGTALTENDIGAGRMNVNRAQVGILEDGTTRGRYATVTASNALKVDGSAVTQPVSGTVTANLSSTDNTVLDNIDANTAPTTGLNTGRKVVTTAGTAVAIASSTTCKWVAITAETDNTDIVVVGDSGVIASLSTREGIPLYPNDSITIPIDNLADVYIDSVVSGEGVTFLYGT